MARKGTKCKSSASSKTTAASSKMTAASSKTSAASSKPQAPPVQTRSKSKKLLAASPQENIKIVSSKDAE